MSITTISLLDKPNDNDHYRFYPKDEMNIETISLIHSLLFNIDKKEGLFKRAFFVHQSVYSKVRKYLNGHRIYFQRHVWDYELRIGTKFYDMKLIFITKNCREAEQIVIDLFYWRHHTFQWEPRFNLYYEKHHFDVLMEFVQEFNLHEYISNIEERSGVNSEDQTIKIVYFNDKVTGGQIKRAMVLLFYSYLLSKGLHNQSTGPFHYYITSAFPWLQPSQITRFNKPMKNNRLHLEMFTFLTCLRDLSYNKEPHLNIFDLCSLKLAFCDFRKANVTHDLEFVIEALIKRSLKRMIKQETYIKNGYFNVQEYAIDTNYILPTISGYAQYHFQDYFKAIITYRQTKLIYQNDLPCERCPDSTMRLVNYNDPYNVLKSTPHVQFQIDGSGYKHMNFDLFFSLANCPNVYEIKLDTNYEWDTNENINRSTCYTRITRETPIKIWLSGSNRFNFIERFISSIKIIENNYLFHLYIDSTLDDYLVINSLMNSVNMCVTNSVTFYDIKLSFDVLEKMFVFSKNYRGYTLVVYVKEDELTWQYLFDYATSVLTANSEVMSTFHYNVDMWIYSDTIQTKYISVKKMKFKITSEVVKKLEIIDCDTDQVVDLYYLKNPESVLPDDDKSVYDY